MAAKSFASSADVADKAETLEVVADGVYALTAEGDPNVGAVEGDDFVVCFEAGATPVAAADWLARLRLHTAKPVRYLVLSHSRIHPRPHPADGHLQRPAGHRSRRWPGGSCAIAEVEMGADSECLFEDVDEEDLADAFARSFVEGENEETDRAIIEVLIDNVSADCAEQVLVAAGVEDGSLDEDDVDCIRENLDDEVALRWLEANYLGEDPDASDEEAFDDAFIACS